MAHGRRQLGLVAADVRGHGRFWGLVIFGVVWLARSASAAAHPSAEAPAPTESPRHVLKRRLASGEISVDEYDALRSVIDDEGPTEPPGATVR